MIRCRMVRGLAVGVALAALTASSPPSAAAPQDGTTTIRSGDHPGFGRVVIDTDAEAAFHLDQVGERVVVRFLSPIILGTAPSSPRNVVAIKISDQT
jgi:cellulose synthase operon protein C